MKASGIVGIVLIVAGVIALVIGSVRVTQEREVLDIGPIEATVEEERNVPIPQIAGIIAIGAGVVVLLVGRRRG